MKSAVEYKREIQRQRDRIDYAYCKIRELAREAIPDFHFLRHEVSTFWPCQDSPIGMCVFDIDQSTGKKTTCRYCSGPVERK